MYTDQQKQKIARIIELAIPIEYFDLLEDLSKHYNSQEKALLEAIKSHHKEIFGQLDDTKVLFTKPSTRISYLSPRIDSPVTNGKISKIIENGKKFEERTQKSLEKVDELLEKLNNLPTLQQMQKELSTMKSMLHKIEVSGVKTSSIRRKRADLSSLEINVTDADEVLLDPPDRPLLETVLDSVLLFDDSGEEEEIDKDSDAKDKKNE
ncbi:MAG: hypothetical protein ACTSX6_14645 [Candidatus Heimdallarchaeaceae archaeon]